MCQVLALYMAEIPKVSIEKKLKAIVFLISESRGNISQLCGLRDNVVWTSTHETVVYMHKNRRAHCSGMTGQPQQESMKIIFFSIAF